MKENHFHYYLVLDLNISCSLSVLGWNSYYFFCLVHVRFTCFVFIWVTCSHFLRFIFSYYSFIISYLDNKQILLYSHFRPDTSNFLPSPYILPTLLPSGNHHTIVCVCEIFVCFSCSFICCFQFYILHMSEIIWLLIFCLTYLAYPDSLKTYPCCLQMAVVHLFLWLSGIQLRTWTASSLSNHLAEDTSVVSMSWPPWKILQWTQGCIYLCK